MKSERVFLIAEEKVSRKINKEATMAFLAALESRHGSVTLEEVQQFIKVGADLNAKNDYGWTPLMFVARWGENQEIVKVLHSSGADVNAKDSNGWTALICAAWWNRDPAMVRTLLLCGADVNAKDTRGRTALEIARQNNRQNNASAISAFQG